MHILDRCVGATREFMRGPSAKAAEPACILAPETAELAELAYHGIRNHGGSIERKELIAYLKASGTSKTWQTNELATLLSAMTYRYPVYEDGKEIGLLED